MARSTVEQHGDDDVRRHVHGMWSAVAGPWAAHADYVDARGAEVAAHMLERAAPAPGERVLELACGPGGVGLAAAPLVLPVGEVVCSDVVPEMAAIAGVRARALGLENVSTRVLDLEQIDEPGASYDVVLCREGLMFAADPIRAAREIARVLRPGGRVVVAVWGERAENPWLGVVLDAVAAELGRPMPPPGVPGPFSLGDEGRLAEVLYDGGLSEVRLSRLPTPARSSSFEAWWATTRDLAGPLTAVLARLPEPAQSRLERRLREAVAPYTTPHGIEIPGLTHIASAAA